VAKRKSGSLKARLPGNPAAPSSDASRFDGDEASLVVMARIVAAHGIQGWVKLRTFTEDPEGLDEYAEWLVKAPEGWRYMALEEFAVRPNGTAAKLQGCDDRAAAERLRGAEVAIPREALGEAEAGSLYWVDLVGLEVVDESGAALGKVESFFETGETSVMVVRGGRERMIPFVPDYVRAVDRAAGRITVAWKAEYDA
jgi:16S rRNA processing protein RimM